MAEYIDKEIALSLVQPDAPEDEKSTVTIATAKKLVRSIIYRTPTADVAPVRHGQWEEASDGDGIVCPFCRTDFCTIIYDTEYFNYCPNCGAKMDEKENDNGC